MRVEFSWQKPTQYIDCGRLEKCKLKFLNSSSSEIKSTPILGKHTPSPSTSTKGIGNRRLGLQNNICSVSSPHRAPFNSYLLDGRMAIRCPCLYHVQ